MGPASLKHKWLLVREFIVKCLVLVFLLLKKIKICFNGSIDPIYRKACGVWGQLQTSGHRKDHPPPPPPVEIVLVKVPMQLSAPKFCSDRRNQLVTRAFFSPQLITSAETVPAVRGRFASSEVHCFKGYGFPGHSGTPAWLVPPFGL